MALKTSGAYQSAINLFILNLTGSFDNSINWRNVMYLAEHYFNLKSVLADGTDFTIGHFPHCLHVVLTDPMKS